MVSAWVDWISTISCRKGFPNEFISTFSHLSFYCVTPWLARILQKQCRRAHSLVLFIFLHFCSEKLVMMKRNYPVHHGLIDMNNLMFFFRLTSRSSEEDVYAFFLVHDSVVADLMRGMLYCSFIIIFISPPFVLWVSHDSWLPTTLGLVVNFLDTRIHWL